METKTEETTVKLRWSSIHSFMKCQRSYQLAYTLGIQKKPGIESRARILGSHVHAGLQAALVASFNGKNAVEREAVQAVRNYFEAAFNPHQTKFDYETRSLQPDVTYISMMQDIQRAAIEIIRYQVPRIGLGTRYAVASVGEIFNAEFFCCDRAVAIDEDSRCLACGAALENAWEVPMIEWTFEAPFEYDAGRVEYGGNINDYHITGTIDAVLRDIQTGEYIIFDWKTRGIMPDARLVDLDGQLRLYAAIVNHMADANRITRICQYQIRNTVPQGAKLTEKTQKVSIAAISSTWEVWSASVAALGLDPEKYREVMEPKLRGDEDFTHPIFSPVTPVSSKIVIDNVLRIGEAIRFASERGDFPAIPSLTGCQYCQFRTLCHVFDVGGDVDFILENEYEIGQPDADDEEELS